MDSFNFGELDNTLQNEVVYATSQVVSVNLTYVGALNVIIVKHYYEVSQKLITSRYRKLGNDNE